MFSININRLLLVILLFFVVGCSNNGPYTTTTSDIIVLEKGYSEITNKAWILVMNPNAFNSDEFYIVVDEPMVWNLIEEGKIYFTSYHREGEEDWTLKQIKNIGDEDSIR